MNIKIVYYGAGMSGKTTNLEYIHLITNPKAKPGATSPSGDKERRRIFDYLPVSMKKLSINLQLFSVPGQVFCADSAQRILGSVNGVVFVVDSRRSRLDATLESFDNLMTNLKEMNLLSTPLVLQYNKRDALDVFSIIELENMFNSNQIPCFEAIATSGVGVFETLKCVTKLILRHVKD